MEPVVTAALIAAGTRLFKTFVEVWNSSQRTDKKQQSVNRWLLEHYESLHDSLSADCVRLMAYVEDGKRLRAGDFVSVLYRDQKLKDKTLELLKSEFRYRLEFMVLIGVFRHLPRVGRYEITRLGVSFLEQARARRHYAAVLLRQ